MKKKLLSFLLTICMVLSLLPTAALAVGSAATSVTVAGQTLNASTPYLVNGVAASWEVAAAPHPLMQAPAP